MATVGDFTLARAGQRSCSASDFRGRLRSITVVTMLPQPDERTDAVQDPLRSPWVFVCGWHKRAARACRVYVVPGFGCACVHVALIAAPGPQLAYWSTAVTRAFVDSRVEFSACFPGLPPGAAERLGPLFSVAPLHEQGVERAVVEPRDQGQRRIGLAIRLA